MNLYKLEFRRKWSKKVESYIVLAEYNANTISPMQTLSTYLTVNNEEISVNPKDCMLFSISKIENPKLEDYVNLNKPQHYAFIFDFGPTGKCIEVEKPTFIDFEKRYMTFHFMQGLRSDAATVSFDDIIGIGSVSSQHKIKGWSGSYIITNWRGLIDNGLTEEVLRK